MSASFERLYKPSYLIPFSPSIIFQVHASCTASISSARVKSSKLELEPVANSRKFEQGDPLSACFIFRRNPRYKHSLDITTDDHPAFVLRSVDNLWVLPRAGQKRIIQERLSWPMHLIKPLYELAEQ